jgi:putative membrane protein
MVPVVESGVEDATRRTKLANERTYLAWWRSGLTAFAVSVGVGKLVPGLSSGSNWPYVVLGICFALLGLAFIGLGYVRFRAVNAALAAGSWSELSDRLAGWLAAAGIGLAVATLLTLALGH